MVQYLDGFEIEISETQDFQICLIRFERGGHAVA
jgi:hypothetical protein